MKIHEIYKRVSNKITANDLNDMEQPLVIQNAEVTGDDKKTVWLDFENQSLRHKCSKTDVFELARQFGTNDTDEFAGQSITLESDGIKVFVKKKNKVKK